METNKILPQAALSQTLSRITQHVDNDHLYPLVRAICNSYEAPHRMAMLEAVIKFRVSNAIADISEGQAEREILDMASRNSNHTVASLFWFLSEYLTTLSDLEREAFDASAVDAPKQTAKMPQTLAEKLEQVQEQINAAALGCRFTGQAFDNYDTAKYLTEIGHERAVDPTNHPYVGGKFTPCNCFADFTSLYIPILNSTLQVVGCQTINTRLTPQKRFNTGLKLAGHFSYVGDLLDGKLPNLILIAEGWKTACVLFEATGIPVVISHGCGNFSTTLVIIAERVGCFSEVKSVLICGDTGTESKVEDARQLAWLSSELATGAVFPDSDVPNYDFADMSEMDGIHTVRQSINSAISLIGEPEANLADTYGSTAIPLFDEGGKKSQATLLIDIGKQFKLFHDDNKDGYAEVTYNAVYALRSRDFKELLGLEFFMLTGKGCNTNAVSDAISTLEAIAKHSGEKHTVHIRTFNDTKSILIDVCDTERQILTINSKSWNVGKDSGGKFLSKRGMTALPIAGSKGDINLLGKYLNINSDDLPLIVGWLLCALGGVKPYPILILQGEQGSGKSTTSRVIRALADPSSVPLRNPPREPKDLLVSAMNTHVVALDNLSGISPEISDCLCRLSTGGGHDVRQLYSDTDQILIDIQKPVIINGIDDIATRPDLAERALIINLPEIKSDNRKSESEFWRDFDKDKAAIFTGLLDCLVSGLANRDSIVLKEKPRMADVAIWVTACEQAYQPERTFIEAHTKNQREAIELGIEASPVGTAIMELMAITSEWVGTPTELLLELERLAGTGQVKSRAWPQSAKGLKNSIKRLMPGFRKLGITITETRDRTARMYTFTRVGIYPSQPSQVSQLLLKPTAIRAFSHYRA